ncbi:type II secretion system F family protein [Haemophilus paraphrohaemolyticus]|uniref:Type II secretion system F domain protein n=2 Tax=Haemophilus TaxID=724 RepID=I2NFK4_9PAST|nr:type II secretion system F family protein [Haemophilus paraphrohaemolyticus]EIG24615.1 type II secretion system F domain protein [Haemophilus paraphrohaemolyticus HK411]OOR93833.1 fimbrial protein [Haemophilus paraphrohaemolyticus]STP02010.1 Cholera toxin secretion protein epsF [Haemophilus paraphrohaemolyticus]
MFKVYEFHWKAINRFQQKQKGKLLARNQDELEQRLIKKGFQQIKISRNFILPKNPKSEEVTQLISQLALLINARLPLKQALSIILENTQNIKIYLWLEEIIRSVELGYSFSKSLENLNRYLNSQEIQLIKMGEMSGKLGVMLENIAQSRSESEKLFSKVKKIMFYPVMVLTIALTLSIGMLVLIVPKFAELYSAKDKTLPFITEILFFLSNLLVDNYIFLLVLLILSSVLLSFLAKKTTIITKLKYSILSNMPVFKAILSQSRIIYFTQNVALMLNASLRLDLILETFLSNKQADPILQKECLSVLTLIKQGYAFSECLNTEVFESQTVQMLSVGEKSGKLAEMSEYVSQIYKKKLDDQLDILSQLLEPVLMVVLGGIVGTIIVGLYLPIFDMGSLVE